MKYQQERRIDKVSYEKFFLLDKKQVADNKIVLYISGSTFNIYNVTFYPYSHRIYCNCPDAKSWAKKQECVCKHCCFCVLKIFKNVVNTNRYFDNLQFTPEESEQILQVINSIKISSPSQNSNELSDWVLAKYQQIKDTDINPKTKENQFGLSKDTEKKNTECPICYDLFDDKDNLKCPTCQNVFHKQCIEMWLKSGQKTCPFCRSSEWNTYFNDDISYQNLVF